MITPQLTNDDVTTSRYSYYDGEHHLCRQRLQRYIVAAVAKLVAVIIYSTAYLYILKSMLLPIKIKHC